MRSLKKMCIFAKKKSTIMEHKYSQEEPETPKVSEPAAAYQMAEQYRVISEEELARCFELDEFKQHMDDLVESTHNHATGCVEITPVVPRRCSIEDAQSRSMTIDQFFDKLHTMVDKFYSAKA